MCFVTNILHPISVPTDHFQIILQWLQLFTFAAETHSLQETPKLSRLSEILLNSAESYFYK